MSNAFSALIWWVIPIGALLGGIAYVVWTSKFKRKFDIKTNRDLGNFQKFQSVFRSDKDKPH